ncbi:protein PUTATIVE RECOMBINATION INITIATION DEFECT 1 [Silene latifolia]|uniref:protein PUTATIVE RECOMBINATION INITIATION DEFECT 1 n=1 Tax=Silene latifolia TaxID=37657 RepID=UPI003D77EC50
MQYTYATDSQPNYHHTLPSQPQPCSSNHRANLSLQIEGGGTICLPCLSTLLSNPNSPTFHVSYALSQLAVAVSQPCFLSPLLNFHAHLVISPLVLSLSSFADDQIARQVVDVVAEISRAGGVEIAGEFVSRIADCLCSCSLVWSRRQFYSLHCLGVLLTCETDTYACIKDKAALIHNLARGLQLPSEEIQGEIMFVLYRICILQYSSKDEEGSDVLHEHCPMILQLSLSALLKTQRDDIRSNCLALLKVLSQRGFLSDAFSTDFNMMDTCEADNYGQNSEGETHVLSKLFAEAIKSPLLSPDNEVQISALDFIFQCLSRGDCSSKQIQILVEENVADYVFEILRLSERKDQVVSSCLQVLDLLSTAEQTFKQRLAIGFTTLVSVLPQVTEVRCHPVQPQMLKLVLDGISSFPGVVSTKILEKISSALGLMLKRYSTGELGMLSETFILVCSIFVTLMKSPSASRVSTLLSAIQDASKHTILTSMSMYEQEPTLLLHSLSLLKEACSFIKEDSLVNDNTEIQLRDFVMEICQEHILPWFITALNGMEEESILGVFETLHFILTQNHDHQVSKLIHTMLSNSWFSLSFGCLGLYPTEKMKLRVYLMFSALVVNLLGDDCGESIRSVVSVLPPDPVDLLFLLGQKSNNNLELSSCQTAVLQILYISSLYDEMLADIKLVLTSLEQYMLSNSNYLLFKATDSIVIVQLLTLYGLCRSTAKSNYLISYSPAAEQIFFQLLIERDWDLSSFNIHPSSLKWLFQQEKISKTLGRKILKFCQKTCSTGNQINCEISNLQDIFHLLAVGDNILPKLLVLMMTQVVGEEMVMNDVISLLHFLSSIIITFPHASDQLCMHGMGNAVQNLCSYMLHPSNMENYMVILHFIFIILSSVNSQTLVDDDAWLKAVMKLLESFSSTITANGWMDEHLISIGIFSLLLHHSTQGVLTKTSKFILLNTALARTTVDELTTNGPSSVEKVDGMHAEQALVFLLVFYHFYLKSFQAVLPGTICWQDFLEPVAERRSSYPSIGIHSQDICRFLHFGSPLIKLVASHCLLELLHKITDQKNSQQTDLKCSFTYLRSMAAVLESLVYHNNPRIAMNCSLCLSIILSWEMPGNHRSLVRNNNWCRIIVEELTMSLAVSCSLATSLMTHHRPAVHIAIALLKSKTTPLWMKSVFDEGCICIIIQNLSPNNISTEVVILFQELFQSGYLKADQIAKVNHLFQARRRCLLMGRDEDERMEEETRKGITMASDLGDICEFLLQLLSTENPDRTDNHAANAKLVEEIDLFFRLIKQNEETETMN